MNRKLTKHNLSDIIYYLQSYQDFKTIQLCSKRCQQIAMEIYDNSIKMKCSFKETLLKNPLKIINCTFTEFQEFSATKLIENQQPQIILSISPSEKLTNKKAIETIGQYVNELYLSTTQEQVFNVLSYFKNLKKLHFEMKQVKSILHHIAKIPSVKELNIECDINIVTITELNTLADDKKKYYCGKITVKSCSDSELFDSFFKVECIQNGRFCVMIDCPLNSSQFNIASHHGCFFSPQQVSKGITITSGMLSSEMVLSNVEKYMMETIEIDGDSLLADVSNLPIQTVKIRGNPLPLILSPTIKRIECQLEEEYNPNVETAGVFTQKCTFYSKMRFTSKTIFEKEAIFYNDIIFEKEVEFHGIVHCRGSVLFTKEVDFKTNAHFVGEARFKMNVSFGGRVIGNEMIFEERCEYWVKPEIVNPHYVHLLPDEMYVGTEVNTLHILNQYEQKKREEGGEENRRDWWGQLSIEEKRKGPEKSMWNFMSNDVDDLADEKVITVYHEQSHGQSKMEIERMNKKRLANERRLVNIDGNDMRSYETVKELSLTSTKPVIEFSLLTPTSITRLEINGNITLDGITSIPNQTFAVTPLELYLNQCQLPGIIPSTVRSLTIKQCQSQVKGPLSLKHLNQLEHLSIQTFSKLNQIDVPSSLKELELNGIPTLTLVDGECELQRIRINLCIKLNSLPFNSSLHSLDSVELNTCPQLIKQFNSLGIKPSFLKLNNKIIN